MVGRCLAVAFLLLLSGCAGKTASPAADGASMSGSEGFQSVTTSARTGGITGLVVDEAVHPLVDARVSLVQAKEHNTTDSQGLFAFAGLEPGAFTLTVEKTGFLAVTQTVAVAAGNATKVKIVLIAAPQGTSAYHVTYAFKGFIEASPAIAGWAVDYTTSQYANDTLCTCVFRFKVDERPVDFIIEAVYEDTVEDPSGLGNYWEFATGSGGNLTNGFSPSPLYTTATGSDYPPDNLDFRIRMTGSWGAVTVEQHYDLYVTVFYRGHAPTGWSLVKGDT